LPKTGEPPVSHVLDKELETFEKHKADLVGRAKGKFVLIKGEEIVGVFETQGDAVRQGYERLGNVPFLVKEIAELEYAQNFTSNLLGI
jgi:hypothetical protein